MKSESDKWKKITYIHSTFPIRFTNFFVTWTEWSKESTYYYSSYISKLIYTFDHLSNQTSQKIHSKNISTYYLIISYYMRDRILYHWSLSSNLAFQHYFCDSETNFEKTLFIIILLLLFFHNRSNTD